MNSYANEDWLRLVAGFMKLSLERLASSRENLRGQINTLTLNSTFDQNINKQQS